MGAAVIRGYQNDPYGKADRMNEVNKEMVNDQMVNGLAACVKHFATRFAGLLCVYRQTSVGMLPDAYYHSEKT